MNNSENTEKQAWLNYGDINFLKYGGCLVRPYCSKKELEEYPNLASYYDVFSLNTEAGENGDQLSAAVFSVDIEDVVNDPDLKRELLKYIGLESAANLPANKIMEAERWAVEIVEAGMTDDSRSYTTDYPESWEDYILTKEQLIQWLVSLDVDVAGMSQIDKQTKKLISNIRRQENS